MYSKNGKLRMSVRAKIEAIETRSKRADSDKDSKNQNTSGKRKRFLYPGKSSNRSIEQQESSLTTLSSGFGLNRTSKPSAISGFEAELQDVWSVKKNIHHTGKKIEAPASSTLLPSGVVQVTAGQYSRHATIPAQQSQGPQIVTNKDPLVKGRSRKDDFTSLEVKRSPLQEHNCKESLWNVRSNTFSYSDTATTSKPEVSAQKNEEHSPPTAKRKTNLGTMDVIKPSNERVLYAKKMAQGYLRSMGMGEYAPKGDKEKSVSPEAEDFTSLEMKRLPLQEHNSKDGVRSSYPDTATTSKPEASPQNNEEHSPPTAKRKTSLETMDIHVIKPSNERVLYAKKMAQGYLRSMGMGEYAPKGGSYEKQSSPEVEEGKDTKWKKTEGSDEFDF